ncbi:MAG: dUTP diphosphatase [Treponema sp.]|nr:dUTP diphosphatase [Treponema sp.]
MTKVNVKCIKKEGAVLPEYKTEGAAGADLYAFLPDGAVVIPAGKFAMIPTGLFFEIPQGYEIQVRPRSGLAAKNGITVLNTPGTIDSDYRGEIKIVLINLGQEDFTINDKDRIAQMIISPVIQAKFEITENLSETERGEGGFGSTGLKA